MPSIAYKGITQRLADTRTGGQIRPVTISTRAAGAIRPALLNTNIAAQQFTPLPEPRIVVDTTTRAIAETARTWVSEAQAYRDREAQAFADDAMLRVNLELKETVSTYTQMQSKDAVVAYDSLTARLDATIQSELTELDPQAKTKFIASAIAAKQSARNALAEHKVRQSRQWQDEIIQAKELEARQALVEKADDTEGFVNEMFLHMETINQQAGKSPEARAVEQAEFFNSTLSDVISTNLLNAKAAAGSGESYTKYLSKAAEYIELGYKSPFKGDGLMLAKESARMDEIVSSINASRQADEHNARALQKEQEEALRSAAFGKAWELRDPSQLNAIADPMDRAKAQELYNTAVNGPRTPPELELKLWQNVDMFIENRDLLTLSSNFPGVNPGDLADMLQKTEPLRDKRSAELITDAKQFADLLVPPLNRISGMFDKPEAMQQHTRISKTLIDAIRFAVDAGQSPTAALEQAKQLILSDVEPNWPHVKLHRTSIGLPPVRNGQLIKYVDSEYAPSESELIDALVHDMVELKEKHGLTSFITDEAEMQYFLQNPRARRQYETGITELYIQQAYIRQKLQESTKSTIQAYGRDSSGRTK